jgi:hypothetical protein
MHKKVFRILDSGIQKFVFQLSEFYRLCIRMAFQVLNASYKGRRSMPANVLSKAEVMNGILRLGCYKQCYLLLTVYGSEEYSISSS